MRDVLAYGVAMRCSVALAAVLMPFSVAHALSFNLPVADGIHGVLNTDAIVGAALRMQRPSSDLIGKANLDPDVCGGHFQSCQGLFRDQSFPAERLVAAPGMFSPNFDDGNLNFDQYDVTQGVFKLSQDLNLTYGNFGLFARWLYFYDVVNNDFIDFSPNRITEDTEPTMEGNSNPIFFNGTFGPGDVVHERRSDGGILRQIGTDLQLLDLNIYGELPLGERFLSFKVGRQSLSWGESTLYLFNSINQTNPINANNFFRVGFTGQLQEVFTPTNMVFLSTDLFANASLEGFYGLEWKGLEAPAPGSFFSFVDLGFPNLVDWASISFGGAAEDPLQRGTPLNNPLSGVTNTTTTIRRLPDNTPRDSGQFGAAFKYFAENLNNGTEFGFYAMRYHSQLPYLSVYATQASCARREGNPGGIDANDPESFLEACPDLPFTHPDDPSRATSDAVPLDTMRFQFDYPEGINLFGISFNTTFGDWSLQGEAAYRPKLPMQVDAEDLVFAAFGPTLSRCHDRAIGCVGSGIGITGPVADALRDLGVPGGLVDALEFGGVGSDEDGNQIVYPPSDFLAGREENGDPIPGDFNDTFDLAIGHAVGSARAFPAFVTPYRGVAAGENPPCAVGLSDEEFNSNLDCYIRGFERFKHLQLNLGATRVYGATDRLSRFIFADQIILLLEAAMSYIPDLPPLDQLQIEGPGTLTHASAGADGTGSDRSRQACSFDPETLEARESCSFGPDGLRFNPTQAPLENFTTSTAWAYAVIALIRYESVFPGISFEPILVWQHAVSGNAPGPGADAFMNAGRKQLTTLVQMRIRQPLSLNLGYTWFTGGGAKNSLRDRDFGQFFVRYQF